MTMAVAGIGAAATLVGGYMSNRAAKAAASKKAKADKARQDEYMKYLKEQANAPKRMQNWNPVEYAQKKEMIEQDNLRRASLGAGMLGGMSHYGAGTTEKSKGGVMRYNRPTGSVMDAMKNSGFIEALKAQQARKLDPGMLDIDKRYITDGIKPGESPDWAVGVKQPPPPAAPPAGALPPGAAPPKPPMNPQMAAYMANRAQLMKQG